MQYGRKFFMALLMVLFVSVAYADSDNYDKGWNDGYLQGLKDGYRKCKNESNNQNGGSCDVTRPGKMSSITLMNNSGESGRVVVYDDNDNVLYDDTVYYGDDFVVENLNTKFIVIKFDDRVIAKIPTGCNSCQKVKYTYNGFDVLNKECAATCDNTQHGSKKHGSNNHGSKKHKHGSKKHGSNNHGSKKHKHGSKKHGSKKHSSNNHGSKKHKHDSNNDFPFHWFD